MDKTCLWRCECTVIKNFNLFYGFDKDDDDETSGLTRLHYKKPMRRLKNWNFYWILSFLFNNLSPNKTLHVCSIHPPGPFWNFGRKIPATQNIIAKQVRLTRMLSFFRSSFLLSSSFFICSWASFSFSASRSVTRSFLRTNTYNNTT